MYYVYFAYSDDVLVYIGEGKLDRYLKIISGTSHCYEANKAHFSGKTLKSEIVESFDTKEEARTRERELIWLHKPAWNIVHRGGKVRPVKFRVRLRPNKKITKWEVIKIISRGNEVSLGRFNSEEEAMSFIESVKNS